MEYVNAVRIVGQVMNEVELKYNDKNMASAKFKVETKVFWKDGGERSTHHKIICWGKMAEYAKNNISMGDWIEITGEIQYRYWKKSESEILRWTEIKAKPPINILQESPKPVEDQSQEAAW